MKFTASELLARADAGTVAVPRDPSYGEAMSYYGVPLRALLGVLPPDPADTIQARANDGFVAEIPRTLISGAAVPCIAVEDLTEAGLRALIRDPAAVRYWPAQQMPGFNEGVLSDSDVGAIIAYLLYLSPCGVTTRIR